MELKAALEDLYPPYLFLTSSQQASKLSLTHFRTFFLNAAGSSRHCFAASKLAGLSSLGELSIEMTEMRMVSGVCTGSQRSAADS